MPVSTGDIQSDIIRIDYGGENESLAAADRRSRCLLSDDAILRCSVFDVEVKRNPIRI